MKYILLSLLSVTPLTSLFGSIDTSELDKLETNKVSLVEQINITDNEKNQIEEENNTLKKSVITINSELDKEKVKNKELKDKINTKRKEIQAKKDEENRIEKEKEEQERIEKEKLEQERVAKEKAEKERIEKENKEKEEVKKQAEQKVSTQESEQTSTTSTQKSAPNTYTGVKLTKSNGRIAGPSGDETYYNLPMDGVISIARSQGIQGDYWVRDDGVKMYGEYIMIATDFGIRPRGSLVQTSLGMGIALDTGTFAQSNPTQIDIAVNW